MKLDDKLFWSRARQVWKSLSQGRQSATSSFNGADALLIWTDKNPGEDEVDLEYSKASMMSLHLFDGFEFPETLFVFTQTSVIVLASEKKVKIVEACKGKDAGENGTKLNLELIVRPKDSAEWPAVCDKVAALIKKSYGGKVTCSFIHKASQPFGQMLSTALSKAGVEASTRGVAAMEEALLAKDKLALDSMKEACKKLCTVSESFRKSTIPSLDDKPMTHEAVRKKIDGMLNDEEKDLESANVTAVQSGDKPGMFDFKLQGWKSKQPDANISLDTIALRIGVACKGYRALVARTVFIDPSPLQRDVYHLLLDIRFAIIEALKPGAKASDVFAAAKAKVDGQDKVPRDAFFANGSVGFGIGLGFGESEKLSPDNHRIIPAGATFVIDLQVVDIKAKPEVADGDSKYFSCELSDVVLVKSGQSEVLTEAANIEWRKNHFRIEEEEEDSKEEGDKAVQAAVPTRRTTRGSARIAEGVVKEQEEKSKEEAMMLRQGQRIMRKQQEALAKEDGDADMLDDGEEGEGANRGKIVNAYSDPKEYPPEAKPNTIYVDQRKECVLLPIGDRAVPFHISTIKNVSKHDDTADSSTLRFNFYFPSGGTAKDMPPEMIAAVEEYPMLAYVKELSFKSRDVQAVNRLHQSIKDLQKRVREKMRKEVEQKDLVEQAKLIVLKERPKERPATLNDVSMQPSINPRGQGRCIGKLRAHVNGFRFSADKLGDVDIMYSNIKFFFFQRGEKELKVLVHFYLRNPIMIGKKKSRHVQFFTEVQEGGVDLGGRGGDRFDPDEIEDEERHRRLVQKLNKVFAQFCKQSLEVAKENGYTIGDDNEIEIVNTEQQRKDGFYGMPAKEMALIQPTEHCLVNLTERDVFVIAVDEIEHIHIERMNIGRSKNFDIVFVLKAQVALDHSGDNLKVVKIEAVPMESFDKVRKWIDDHDPLTFTCAPTMLNWDEVLKQVRYELSEGIFWKPEIVENGQKVKKDIGWLFLSPEAVQGGDSDEDDDEEEDDSEYESDDSEEEDDEDDDDDDDDEEDDDDEDASEVDEDEDEDEDEEDDEEDDDD